MLRAHGGVQTLADGVDDEESAAYRQQAGQCVRKGEGSLLGWQSEPLAELEEADALLRMNWRWEVRHWWDFVAVEIRGDRVRRGVDRLLALLHAFFFPLYLDYKGTH